jgi:hypothetical protein
VETEQTTGPEESPRLGPEVLEQLRRRGLVAIEIRTWEALRRQLARMVIGWRYVDREVERVLEACKHVDDCPALRDRAQPCKRECADRETFLSALVVAGNARQFAMLPAQRPATEYRPPPREVFDEIVAELEVLRAGRDVLAEIADLMADGSLPVGAAAQVWPPTAPAERPLTRLIAPEDGGESIDDEGE